MEPSKRLADLMKSTGYSDLFRQEGVQEGIQKGVQEVFALLEKGYSPAEAKKMLQPLNLK